MNKISFQFHACQEELAMFILNIAEKFNLAIVLIDLFPDFRCRVGNYESLIFNDILNSREVFLMKGLPVTNCDDYLEFMKSNNNFMNVLLGNEGEHILSESIISATGDDETMALWKKIIGCLKKTMLCGAWVCSADGRTKKYYKNHRYTACAKRKYDQGVQIRPIAGNITYELKYDK